MDKLRNGQPVNIFRNHGTIHLAFVRDVSIKHGRVLVEWLEDGMFKCKPIPFEELLVLNPELGKATTVQKPNQAIVRDINSNAKAVSENHETVNRRGIRIKGIADKEITCSFPTTAERKVDKGFSTNRTALIQDRPCSTDSRKGKISNVRKVLKGQNSNDAFYAMVEEYRNTLNFHPMTYDNPTGNRHFSVCVRKRPLNSRERSNKVIDIVTMPSTNCVILHKLHKKVDLSKCLDNHTFHFDNVFDENATNEIVFNYTAKPLVKCVFEKGFATCFVFGETGSGKTYTMGGEIIGKSQNFNTGISIFVAQEILLMANAQHSNNQLVVYCSFFEIYNGQLFDLLSGRKNLRILDDNKGVTNVVGLKEVVVDCKRDLLMLIKRGSETRVSNKTRANHMSSRSHSILQIHLRNATSNELCGKFSLVDLAGCERGVNTLSSDHRTRMETVKINSSLFALKECIRALSRKAAHVPFRNSKLTHVLRDSFTGDNVYTCMIAQISPGHTNYENSLNTLQYADDLKELTDGA